MPGTYLFIDGNYLEERYKARMRPFFDDDGELDYGSLRCDTAFPGLRRGFYYNSIDYSLHKGEEEKDQASRVKALESKFDVIDAIPDFHVRPGSVTAGSRKRREQKKVDILLAVDMLTHANNHNMDQVILIAGDLDFSPLVAAVVRLGVRVSVMYDPSSVSRELAEEADDGVALGLRDYYRWSSKFYRLGNPIPEEMQIQGSDFRESRHDRIELQGGRCEGHTVRLLKLTSDNAFAVAIRDELAQVNTVISDKDKDRLLKYTRLEYPALTWD